MILSSAFSRWLSWVPSSRLRGGRLALVDTRTWSLYWMRRPLQDSGAMKEEVVTLLWSLFQTADYRDFFLVWIINAEEMLRSFLRGLERYPWPSFSVFGSEEWKILFSLHVLLLSSEDCQLALALMECVGIFVKIYGPWKKAKQTTLLFFCTFVSLL